MRKDGAKIVVNMNVGIVTYRGRVASLGILKDITERKRTEEKLRLQSQILETIEEGVFLVRESDGIIVYANPGFE